MFNNLIESSSHRSEFKRRGSFILYTVAGYALFFALAGVVSIHAYDARMADQSLELVTMMPLVDLAQPSQPRSLGHAAPRDDGSKNNYYERKNPIASVEHSQIPDQISSKPNPELPLPNGGVVRFGNHDSNPGSAEGPGGSGYGGNYIKNPGTLVTEITPPPPAPVRQPVPKVISKGVITSEALSLPKPPYPPIAKQLRIQGTVSIQVLIDEAGNVVSAKALSGSTFLIPEAQKAAYKARFSPTLVGDQPVKVSGVITYNFILQR